MGFLTWLTTNGTLYPKYAKVLKGNVSILSFSLDAPTAKIHDDIRGIQCFNKVIESIKIARSLGESVLIKHIVCEENVKELKRMVTLAQKLGALIELNAEFAYFGDRRPLNKNIEQILKLKRHPNVIISKPHLQFMKDGGNNPSRPKCHIGKNMIVIAPDNTLYYPCMHHVKKQLPLVHNNMIQSLNYYQDEFETIGTFSFCNKCTIPCYMESSYYTELDKYMFLCLYGRIDYIKKQAYLYLRNKLS